jgi:hypothetical protein
LHFHLYYWLFSQRQYFCHIQIIDLFWDNVKSSITWVTTDRLLLDIDILTQISKVIDSVYLSCYILLSLTCVDTITDQQLPTYSYIPRMWKFRTSYYIFCLHVFCLSALTDKRAFDTRHVNPEFLYKMYHIMKKGYHAPVAWHLGRRGIKFYQCLSSPICFSVNNLSST